MFYSHFILARKGPLATVWMAAHLQHKLRKSQVAETNISASVDSIMFPEVPIALRLSGHLLLGVVRIYSRKVDYLHHDCNEILTKLRYAFASIEIDGLPEDASTAPVHTITIPETLELDAVNVDQAIYGATEVRHIHIRSQEDITIPDQVHGEEELYAIFNIDEESSLDRIEETVVPGFGSSHMDIEDLKLHQVESGLMASLSSHSYFPRDVNVAADDPTATVNVDKHSEQHHEDDIVGEDIEFENLRALNVSGSDLRALNVSGSAQAVGELQDHDKTNEEPHVPCDQVAEDHDLSFTNTKTPTRLAASSTPSHQLPQGFVSSEVIWEQNNSPALIPTPPARQPAIKPRKRKQQFDLVIVLSNDFMKKQLDDTRNLKRKRRAPCTAVKILQSHRNSRWEQIFQGPLISGMSAKLEDLLKRKHFPPAAGQSSREVIFECGEAEPPIRTPLNELEMEQHRHKAGYSNDIPAEILPSKNFTPSTAATLESVIHTENDSRMGLDPEKEVQETLESAIHTENDSRMGLNPEREVPDSAEPNLAGIDASATDDAYLFSPEETPEFALRQPSEDLDCLEADASQTGTTQDRAESWSVRTRAVARYLQQSFKGSLDSPGRLNLSNILEGRRRKECARMFYEVLVLKSRGCIELDQEKPYDDITIFQAPGLTNIYL